MKKPFFAAQEVTDTGALTYTVQISCQFAVTLP
jgi:hypothetical protein